VRLRLAVRRLAFAAVLAALGAGAYHAPDLLRELDFFRVERAEVSGVKLLAPHEVLAASGLRPEHSVWDDPAPWTAALRAHPVIRDATVERSLPRTLRIRIVEHRPVALVEAGALRPATAEGAILPVDPALAEVDLPLVRGSVGGVDRVEDDATRLLLGEIARIAQLDPALAARVSEVRRDASGDVLLLVGRPAVELVVSAGVEPGQLRRVQAVLDDLERRSARGVHPEASVPVRVDARFRDQVVVRFPS
jgi:hypothetical protein